MKVCLVAPSAAVRGVGGACHVQSLLTALGEVGASVDLLVDDCMLLAPVNSLPLSSSAASPSPRRRASRPPDAPGDAAIAVSRLLLEHQASRGWDVVHAIGAADGTLAAVIAARLCGCPVVVSDIGLDQTSADHVTLASDRMARLAFRGADLVLASSGAAADGIRARYAPPGRLAVLEMPLDLQPFRTVGREVASVDPHFHIVTVCSWAADWASADDLLAALELQPRPETMRRLSIVGPPVEKGAAFRAFLEERLDCRNLARFVSLVGTVADRGMPDFLVTADTYVDSGREGPHDAIAVAALAVGCPVIAAARAANVALFAGEPAVTLFDIGDAHGLSRAIHGHMTSMTKNLGRRDAMRLAQKLADRFSPMTYATKLVGLYRSLSAAR